MQQPNPQTANVPSTQKIGAQKYAPWRLWVIAAVSLLLTAGSAYLPFTKPSDSAASGACKCTSRYGGFPIPFAITGDFVRSEDNVNVFSQKDHPASPFSLPLGIPAAQALTIEDIGSSSFGCGFSCTESRMMWLFAIVDVLLIFYAGFTVDRAVFVSKNVRKYWLAAGFLVLYVCIYLVASSIMHSTGPGGSLYQ